MKQQHECFTQVATPESPLLLSTKCARRIAMGIILGSSRFLQVRKLMHTTSSSQVLQKPLNLPVRGRAVPGRARWPKHPTPRPRAVEYQHASRSPQHLLHHLHLHLPLSLRPRNRTLTSHRRFLPNSKLLGHRRPLRCRKTSCSPSLGRLLRCCWRLCLRSNTAIEVAKHRFVQMIPNLVRPSTYVVHTILCWDQAASFKD